MKKILIFLCLIAGVGVSGCSDPMDEITTLDLDRALSPTDLSASVYNQTGVRLNWKLIGNASSYTIEIFDNEGFSGSPVKTVTGVTPGQIPYTITGLDSKTKYYVRVKAIGEGADDSKWITANFTTETEQILDNISAAKISPTSVTVNWIPGEAVTSIKLSPGDITHTITPTELAAGQATITGLTPSTTYTVVLYRNNAERGNRTFTTMPDLPTGPNVVYVLATDNLATLIQGAVSGNIFVLRTGTKYTADDLVAIPAGVSLTIWGETGGQRPVVAFNGFDLPATTGTIKFENIDLTGYQDNDVSKTKRAYVFNQNKVSTTTEIVFENCVIRNFANSVVRLQGSAAITIDKVTVNKCTVYDIGDNGANGTYAFLNNSVASAKVNNIVMTNNTFYKLGYALILHNNAPSQTVLVENNTFNNVVGDGRYLIDYNSQVASITFRNNIVGKTLSPAATAKGIRLNASGTLTVTNSFQTSDAVLSPGITGITSYGKSSTDLFTDPNAGNFLIKDIDFLGKSSAGDPRWRR